MARGFPTHPVSDYEKWRPIFDADRPRLAAAGVTVVAVLRDTANPNLGWSCLDGERAVGEKFLQDPEVGKIMQEAGVLAPPEVFWVD